MEQNFISELHGNFALRQPKGKKPTMVYFVVRIGGKQLKISTGLKVYPDQWNKRKQMAYTSDILTQSDNTNNFLLNQKLTVLKAKFAEFIDYLCSHPTEFNNGEALLRKYLGNEIAMKESKEIKPLQYLITQIQNDNQKNDQVKKAYLQHVKAFEDYLKAHKIAFNSFNDLTIDMVNGFVKHLQSIRNAKTKDGSLSIEYINNTVKGLLQHINVYVIVTQRMDVATFNTVKSLYKPLKNKVTIGENEIALREDEVTILWRYKCDNETDEQVKDLFVLQCVTGQRISDIEKVATGADTTEGLLTLQIKQKKCGLLLRFQYYLK